MARPLTLRHFCCQPSGPSREEPRNNQAPGKHTHLICICFCICLCICTCICLFIYTCICLQVGEKDKYSVKSIRNLIVNINSLGMLGIASGSVEGAALNLTKSNTSPNDKPLIVLIARPRGKVFLCD